MMKLYSVLIAIVLLMPSTINSFTLPPHAIKSVHSFPALKSTSERLTPNNEDIGNKTKVDIRQSKNLAKVFANSFYYDYDNKIDKVKYASVKDFKKLALDNTKPDVKLELSNGKSFLVHRIVLSTRSRKFRDLLSSPAATAVDGLIVLKLDDVDEQVIKELICIMYSNNFSSSTKTTIKEMGLPLYYAAQKYQIHEIVEVCELYLLGCISTSNVLYLSDIAKIYNIQRLKDATSAYIDKYPELVLNDYALYLTDEPK